MSTNFFKTPKTSDNKPIFLPNLFRGDVYPLFHGRSDDITNGVRFGGTYFKMQATEQGDSNLTFQFMEWVYLAGGIMECDGAVFGDRVNFKIYAPASPATSNPGDGDFNKYNLGGSYNMIVPTAPGTGDWDVNLQEKLNENVSFTKVVPVPAPEGTGWFDWDYMNENVTVNIQGKGNYYLFDFQTDLVHYVIWQHLLGSSRIDFIKPAVKPRRMLPHWIYRTDLHREGTSGTLNIVWSLLCARKEPKP